MARTASTGGGRGPCPRRPQTVAERLMPRQQFEALERRRDARWERGDDPNVETDDEDDPEDVFADIDANAETEARLRTITTLARLICINKGAATALFDNQNIVGLESLRPLKAVSYTHLTLPTKA